MKIRICTIKFRKGASQNARYKRIDWEKVKGARGEGTIIDIDVKGNIVVDYNGKKFKHPSVALEKGLIKLVDEESSVEEKTSKD